jgi:uncharacterized protein
VTSRCRRSLAAFAILWLWAAVLHADFPKPAGAVNDFADILTDMQEQALADLVQRVEDATTTEIAVASVTALDGMTVEEYANRLFAAWGIGQRGKDNGVLILVAPREREMRIEVGYGLEEILPDGLAGQIVQETFIPRFRTGEYGLGIVEGTNRVAAILRRNQPLTPDQRAAVDRMASASHSDLPIEWVLVPFFGLFVAIGFGMGGSGLGARALGPIFFGMVFGGVPWLLSFLLMNATGAGALSAIAFAATVIGILIGRQSSYRTSMRGTSAGASKTGWVWGSAGASGRSSGSSGGSRSSGSSFGGGRSGGGGASGRW